MVIRKRNLLEDWDILTVSNIPSFLSELQEVRPIRAGSGIYKRFSAVYRHLSFRGITTCLRFSSCFTNHCLKVWITIYILYAHKHNLFGQRSTSLWWQRNVLVIYEALALVILLALDVKLAYGSYVVGWVLTVTPVYIHVIKS